METGQSNSDMARREDTDKKRFKGDLLTLAKPNQQRRDINPRRCITNIEWAAGHIKDEILHGGQFLIGRDGRPVKDENGKRVFVHSPSLSKIKGLHMYADIQFKLLKKVKPDAVVDALEDLDKKEIEPFIVNVKPSDGT